MSRPPFTPPNPGEFQDEKQGAKELGFEAGLMQDMFSDLYGSRRGGSDPFTNMFDNFMGDVMSQALKEQFQPFDQQGTREAHEVNLMDKIGNNSAATEAIADSLWQKQQYDQLGLSDQPGDDPQTKAMKAKQRKDYLHANYQSELNNLPDDELERMDKLSAKGLVQDCQKKDITEKFGNDTTKLAMALAHNGKFAEFAALESAALTNPNACKDWLSDNLDQMKPSDLAKLASEAQKLP